MFEKKCFQLFDGRCKLKFCFVEVSFEDFVRFWGEKKRHTFGLKFPTNLESWDLPGGGYCYLFLGLSWTNKLWSRVEVDTKLLSTQILGSYNVQIFQSVLVREMSGFTPPPFYAESHWITPYICESLPFQLWKFELIESDNKLPKHFKLWF